MKDFRSLAVWQKAHACALAVYQATAGFPRSEEFGLTRQLRRSTVSIASNLAEGSARSSDRDFARFVEIAIGSAAELDYQLLLARDLHYLRPEEADQLSASVVEVRRMLIGLYKALRNG